MALDIIGDGDRFESWVTNRTIRAWSSAAQSESAFPVLRVLKLSFHPQVTEASLAYIDSFPSLDIYEVESCGFDWKTIKKLRLRSWHPTQNPALPYLEHECTDRAETTRIKLGGSPKKTPIWYLRRVTLLPRAQVPKFLAYEQRIRTGFYDRVLRDLGYEKVCRIGEIRDDGDFERAGIDIGDQPIYDGELISPLPIANIRLGSGGPPYPKRDRAKEMLFIRLKLQGQESSDEEENVPGPLKRPSSSTDQLPPAKRKVTAKQRKKKDLGDVLGSFMA